MLFSEPKIPQFHSCQFRRVIGESFSALQRAENSSIGETVSKFAQLASFSALQRAENSSIVVPPAVWDTLTGFSALQRAENSSMRMSGWRAPSVTCFSALQRAENSSMFVDSPDYSRGEMGFSALQRAENSSMGGDGQMMDAVQRFQCSSASRKFLNRSASATATGVR